MEGDFSVCLFGGGGGGGWGGAACRAYVYRRGSTRVLGFWPAFVGTSLVFVNRILQGQRVISGLWWLCLLEAVVFRVCFVFVSLLRGGSYVNPSSKNSPQGTNVGTLQTY